MAAPNIADLFGDTDDEDNDVFQPTQRQKTPQGTPPAGAQEQEPRPAEYEAEAAAGLSDDDDEFLDRPAPVQPLQSDQRMDFSDEEDDQRVQQGGLQDRPQGPPQDMSGALLPIPPSSQLRLLQTSKFLAIQSLPMTPENLKLERASAVLDEETEEVRYSYKKQMTIRWRERTLPSGETQVESNARFVKWSDGTTQLFLGDEVLDISELDNTSASQYLFVRHTHPVAFIQGQGQLRTKLHLRPASLTSKFHKQLTADAARKHVKVNKVKATATVRDPAALKMEREKAEEERIRSRGTLQRRQEREMKKYPPISRREYRPTGITSNFLETIEDEPEYSDEEDLSVEGQSPPSLKRRRQLEEEEEVEAERRLARAKQDAPKQSRPAEHREERQERTTSVPGGMIISDDEDDDIVARQPVRKARRGLVISDDEDD